MLEDFAIQYVAAFIDADLDLIDEWICLREISMLCMISRTNLTKTPLRGLLPAGQTSLNRAATRLMSRRIRYYRTLEEWVALLEGLARRRARVLVVTSFPASVATQIPRLAAVHPLANLSGLAVRVLGVPISYSWNEQNVPGLRQDGNWSATLRRLKASAEWDPDRNDVALLGCAAYGLPLVRPRRQRSNWFG